jgi:hypothetical protein
MDIRPSVAVISGAFDDYVVNMFRKEGWRISGNVVNADLICLTGGEDIGTHLYGQKKTDLVWDNPERDEAEERIFNTFSEKKKAGICRGGQMLNVLSGGSMWQDVDKHDNGHVIRDIKSGEEIFVTSMHHQMMIPSDEGEIFAVANIAKTFTRMDESGNAEGMFIENPRGWGDCEGVWYPKTKSLCYQPHPEVDDEEGTKYFFKILQDYHDLATKRYVFPVYHGPERPDPVG